MPRVKKGAARRQGRRRILQAAKGHRGAPGHLYRLATETVVHSEIDARIGRKQRKRQLRGLWIVRLNAACRARGLRYSQLVAGCKKANIGLNRKMLSEIAIADPSAFDAIIQEVKAALA
jgi:large subunit ribosomal protein L20